MYDVFLCYSPPDHSTAEAVHGALLRAGLCCFFPDAESAPDEAALRLAVEDSLTLVLLYTDNANMDSVIARRLDFAAKAGTETVTLRLSNSMPLGRTGFYMTIPYTVDGREQPPEIYLPALAEKVLETTALVKKNRAKTADRHKKKPSSFRLPGIGSDRWYLSLFAVIFYVAVSVVLLSMLLSLINIPDRSLLLENIVSMTLLSLLIILPILLLGNLFSLRDRLPLFRKRKPGWTLLGILLIELLLFLIFEGILYLMQN